MFQYYILALTSVLLYLQGFFPVPSKKFESTLSSGREAKYPNRDTTKFDKTVLMVIDALRLDFVTPDYMPFLSSQSQENGCFINLKVETPTVTLPRIKALTTGNLPQFVDVILNLADAGSLEDSLIHRAVAEKRTIVFYGDDTWLRLFPTHFKRSEGTTSFYVTDFKEVDNNVTRNVKYELKQNDWDIMVLHYLGLDHIGHVGGPRSPLIPPKLKEMDEVFQEIFTSLKDERYLIIVTGDHGMKDSGSHGGSTYSETNIPFIVSGILCKNDSFSQIDVAANLAIWLGLPIPQTSIGQIKPSLLGKMAITDYLQVLKYNTELLRDKIDLCEEEFTTATHFHDLYLLKNQSEFATHAITRYEKCTKLISDKLIKSSNNQNIISLIISIIGSFTVLLKVLKKLVHTRNNEKNLEIVLLFIALLLQFLNFNYEVSLGFLAISSLILVKSLIETTEIFESLSVQKATFLICVSILHPLTFLSSSFIEEEHMFWYFFSSLFILLNFVASCFSSLKLGCPWLAALIIFRFLRTINQTGNQWASLPDLSDWLLELNNYVYFQIFFVVSLILAYISCDVISKRSFKFNKFIDILILSLIYVFRTVAKEDANLGKFLWFLILTKLIFNLLVKNSVLSVFTLTISLLLKPYNIILVPSCVLASQFIHKMTVNRTSLTLAHMWLGNLLYFAQGHCNSIASVDVSSGYIGLTQHQLFLVIPQVLCHTFALPVLSLLLLMKNEYIHKLESLSIYFIHRLYVLLIVFVVTFTHRHHLFIWSVFAPKVIIEACHFGILFLEACCYYVIGSAQKLLKRKINV